MNIGWMRVANIVKVGLQSIGRNKMRSALTMLGIVIGVACVIAMVAVASGASSSIQAQIDALGTNFLMVFPGTTTSSGARMFSGASNLSVEDAAAIRAECPAVAYVSASAKTSAQVVAGELNWATQVQGVDVDWPFIRSWNLAEGDFFTSADVRSATKVAVLGRTVADALFPNARAVGETLRIKNVPFHVVGVLERKGGSTMGQDQDDTIIAPYTTVTKRLEGHANAAIIYVAAISPNRVGEAKNEIDLLLRQRHRIGPRQDADFMIRSQEEMASTAAASSKTLSVLLGSVAAISLLVGGIGIMNIMLVSVTERTREIGIRMAIGAKGRHVLAQFLLEAVVLSVVGGLIGILLGVAASQLIARYAGWPVSLGAGPILMAFGFAALIGIFFGFYPARRASALDPIDALRFE
ncbi:MAG: ABC transporter permease [Thermoanaerobaculia bacterium]